MKTRVIFHFNRTYFDFSLFILLVELLIANHAQDPVIRPYGGDFLAVILLYCLIKAFFNIQVISAAILSLLISFSIEQTQYFHLAEKLNFPPGSWQRILLGDYFSWWDILAYTLGIAVVLTLEKSRTLKFI